MAFIYLAVAIGSLILLVALLLIPSRSRASVRLADLVESPRARETLGSAGEKMLSMTLKQRSEEELKKRQEHDRLMQAGFYGRNSAVIFSSVKIASMAIPLALGWAVGQFTTVPLMHGLLVGAIAGFAGMLLPSFYLDYCKRGRQQQIRRSLPDALDVLTVCLEGGMSLTSSFSRVAQELAQAHPELALELSIVDRETRMGRTTGESVRSFADRFDLEEVRSMSSVIVQAERYGASVAAAMDVYADTMRHKRMSNAETKAQQAVVKVIFPTLLCIFPCLFIIILGPAAISIVEMFSKMR